MLKTPIRTAAHHRWVIIKAKIEAIDTILRRTMVKARTPSCMSTIIFSDKRSTRSQPSESSIYLYLRLALISKMLGSIWSFKTILSLEFSKPRRWSIIRLRATTVSNMPSGIYRLLMTSPPWSASMAASTKKEVAKTIAKVDIMACATSKKTYAISKNGEISKEMASISIHLYFFLFNI